MQINHFLILKKLKNTESAQPWTDNHCIFCLSTRPGLFCAIGRKESIRANGKSLSCFTCVFRFEGFLVTLDLALIGNHILLAVCRHLSLSIKFNLANVNSQKIAGKPIKRLSTIKQYANLNLYFDKRNFPFPDKHLVEPI